MKHTHKTSSKLPNCIYHSFEVQLVTGEIYIFTTVNNYFHLHSFFFFPKTSPIQTELHNCFTYAFKYLLLK